MVLLRQDSDTKQTRLVLLILDTNFFHRDCLGTGVDGPFIAISRAFSSFTLHSNWILANTDQRQCPPYGNHVL